MDLLSLWLPLVVASIGVFFASSLMHMVLPFHRKDYNQLPNEDEVLEVLRKSPPAPAHYMMPYASGPEEANTPEMKEKYAKGPVAMINVLAPGSLSMGRSLGGWFVMCVIGSLFCAYVASATLAPGADYLKVFQVVGAVAFAVYALGEPVNSIWRGQPWGNTCRAMVDGLVYSLVSAGVFGWLWPAA